ncbi:MAG: hypothetical protein JWN99_1685, partial [Ilumatobacteraceae bacterium]|nr:hypothetical protein [Ilumatobacteraceae bacterium]
SDMTRSIRGLREADDDLEASRADCGSTLKIMVRGAECEGMTTAQGGST